MFQAFAADFRKYHADPVNVSLHLLTTPLGIFGALSLVNSLTKHHLLSDLAVLVYVISLIHQLPVAIFLPTVCIMYMLRWFAATFYSSESVLYALMFLFVGYFGQDLAHIITHEPTFQGSYDKLQGQDWANMFVAHTYFLIPLCLDAFAALKGHALSMDVTNWYYFTPQEVSTCISLLPLLLLVAGQTMIDGEFRLFPWQCKKTRVVQVRLPADHNADLHCVR